MKSTDSWARASVYKSDIYTHYVIDRTGYVVVRLVLPLLLSLALAAGVVNEVSISSTLLTSFQCLSQYILDILTSYHIALATTRFIATLNHSTKGPMPPMLPVSLMTRLGTILNLSTADTLVLDMLCGQCLTAIHGGTGGCRRLGTDL
jgi:hypothetical protein